MSRESERRNTGRKWLSPTRTVAVGVMMIVIFSVYTIGINLLLKRLMDPDAALLLSVAACIGAAVVVGMWLTEGAVARQNEHVHGHLRKVSQVAGARK